MNTSTNLILLITTCTKRSKSLLENVEPHRSTILEDEMLNSFLLERTWQVLQRKHI